MQTDKKLLGVVGKHAELVAKKQAEIIDGYFLIHIRKKPKWMPKSLYNLFLSKLVYLDMFKKI